MKSLDTLLRMPDCPCLAPYIPSLRENLQSQFLTRPHGDMQRWLATLDSLPNRHADFKALSSARVTIGNASELDSRQSKAVLNALRALTPWRKGPFGFFGIDIDSEWRSDWKWQRLASHIDDLGGRRVLDVGCGNGYYLWRMRGAGAELVLGVDPTVLCLIQFAAAQHFLADPAVYLLPLRGEDLPEKMPCFDTVFSMGVLYHRREPLAHLSELRGKLTSSGQLVLESLVIDGPGGELLVPQGRYAQMRNV